MTITRELRLSETSDYPAGAAALTLLEALLIHLEETGLLDAPGRDQVFETAIQSHELAQESDADLHARIIHTLRTLHARSNGVRLVGVRKP